jgi:hypothetical protein
VSWIDALEAGNTSHRGVLTVFHLARSKRWRWPWSPLPTLEETVAAARAQWEAREDQVPTLDDVEVIGIDLTRIPPVQGKKDGWDRIFDFLRWRCCGLGR